MTAVCDKILIEEVRHTICHGLLFIVRSGGIEIKCAKCGALIFYTWRQILIMMLAAEWKME
jgi:hypothetical protein